VKNQTSHFQDLICIQARITMR